jgi:hypothetical protein
MKINLPEIPAFDSKNILLMGGGGGYDYLGTELFRSALASGRNFSYIRSEHSGVQPLLQSIRAVVESDKIETIIVIDGGVDSLMRGDEVGSGTLLEDTVTLAAVANVDVPHKILVCMGFGTEVEEGLCHYRALENIADLTRAGGFLGCCALTPEMSSFQCYKNFCESEWEGKRKSHIHTRIIPAVMGHFGEQTMYDGVDAHIAGQAKEAPAFINPLMTLCWFFDLMKVYERSLFAKKLVPTGTRTDALMIYRQILPELLKNPRPDIDIPL